MAVLGLATEMPRHLGFASCNGSGPTRLSTWRAARPAGRGQRSAPERSRSTSSGAER